MLHTRRTRLPRSPVFGALEEFRKADSSYCNISPLVDPDYLTSSNMTPEQIAGCKVMEKRMQSVCSALEELLVAAQKDDRLTMGIYESAKLLNADPDSVVLCVLASDDHEDIGLQIHYTLLRSFCCDSNITILRVAGVQRLRRLLGRRDTVADIVDTDGSPGDDQGDFNCLLVTDPHADHLRLQEVGTYCTESRRHGQWLPELVLEER